MPTDLRTIVPELSRAERGWLCGRQSPTRRMAELLGWAADFPPPPPLADDPTVGPSLPAARQADAEAPKARRANPRRGVPRSKAEPSGGVAAVAAIYA